MQKGEAVLRRQALHLAGQDSWMRGRRTPAQRSTSHSREPSTTATGEACQRGSTETKCPAGRGGGLATSPAGDVLGPLDCRPGSDSTAPGTS
jgi:hypothetical protein